MAFCEYNNNPGNIRVGDCTVRAISAALGEDWADTYLGMCAKGFELNDMPSSNHVWGSYLRSKGYKRHILPESCPDCYSVKDFCNDHPIGTFIVAMPSHVLAIIDGNYYDHWDSGDEKPIYYWTKKTEVE